MDASPDGMSMDEGFSGVVEELERRKRAIESALEALRGATGDAESPVLPPAAEPAARPGKRKVRLTPEGRRRLAEAMKRRWAVKRSAAQGRKRGRKKA